MTNSQRIRHNHDQTEAAWKRAEKQWRGNPDYQERFPNGERDCKAGIQLCRDINAEAA